MQPNQIKSSIVTIAKFVDQPQVVKKVSDSIPAVLIGGSTLYAALDTFSNNENNSNQDKKKKFTKNSIVLATTVAASLIAARGLPFKINGKQIFKGFIEAPNVNQIKEKATELLKTNTDVNVKNILNKITENKILSLKDLNKLKENNLLETLIPSPKAKNVKEIFGEIFDLSMLGAIPVIGGITGGIIADKVNGENVKETLPNKVKEGFYQFFANIFLCNVGAGLALGGLEGISNLPNILKNKFNIENQAINLLNKANTRIPRAVGMIAGIGLVGVFGGSKIANIIGDKIINPLMNGGKPKENKEPERTPELVDIALHTDDIATVGVLSGFKWIEPVLPLMYTLSGYRAGIGYRNHIHGAKQNNTNHTSNKTHGQYAFTSKNIELENILEKRFKKS